MWCRNCSESKRHSGLGGNFWSEKSTGDLVYECHRCSHLRTTETVEIEAGTVLEFNGPSDQTVTVGRDGWLEPEEREPSGDPDTYQNQANQRGRS